MKKDERTQKRSEMSPWALWQKNSQRPCSFWLCQIRNTQHWNIYICEHVRLTWTCDTLAPVGLLGVCAAQWCIQDVTRNTVTTQPGTERPSCSALLGNTGLPLSPLIPFWMWPFWEMSRTNHFELTAPAVVTKSVMRMQPGQMTERVVINSCIYPRAGNARRLCFQMGCNGKSQPSLEPNRKLCTIHQFRNPFQSRGSRDSKIFRWRKMVLTLSWSLSSPFAWPETKLCVSKGIFSRFLRLIVCRRNFAFAFFDLPAQWSSGWC